MDNKEIREIIEQLKEIAAKSTAKKAGVWWAETDGSEIKVEVRMTNPTTENE